MNILVIGNGFDLAHGLPTKYGDFLEFCNKASKIYTLVEGRSTELYISENLDGWEISSEIKEILKNAFINRKLNRKPAENGNYCEVFSTNNNSLDEFYSYIKDNVWVEYFLNCDSYIGENWIDFEMEISRVIQSLDQLREVTRNSLDLQEVHQEKQKILMHLLKASNGSLQKDYGSIKGIDNYVQFLNVELERLIRALEIYIAEFIAKISISLRNSDIGQLAIGHVLSFNYSDTYKKIYGANKKIRYDYIHGIANINNALRSNNMVLGIDEYLSIERRDKEIEFIAFKKYYQRIFKGTGCEYKEWLFEVKEKSKTIESELRHQYPIQIPFEKFTNDTKNYLYIFGHSLDITDKDIFRDLILNDNVYTTIFYYNKNDLSSKIANLVKVLGQDELIKRTGGSTKTIEFRLQQDMLETSV